MLTAPQDLPQQLKLLSDPVRLRMLALLEREELSVGELARSLDLAQSRVSNHLRVLREGDWLVERRLGTSILLRSAAAQPGAGESVGLRLWASLRPSLADLPGHEADLARLADVLAERRLESTEFFDAMAGEWEKRGALFENGQARHRAVAGLLDGPLTLADLGCGTGYMARALAAFSGRLICVDPSPGMLEQARRALAHLPPSTQVEYRQGDIEDLPLEDASLDGALAGMVLHHLERPDTALREMRRVLRPGARAVVLELSPHKEHWMHQELGDRHLGLAADEVRSAMARAGFEDLHVEPLEDRYCPTPPGGTPVSLPLYIVRGRVPASIR
ncbi:MAG: metalloregulator ArsR/SmtB family transcription factor [Planctomycetota bacterium]